MIRQLLIMYTLSFVMIGCGGSGGTKDRVMEIGQSYSVSTGDVIVKASDEASIKITHISGKTISTVSLIDGNATITHPKE